MNSRYLFQKVIGLGSYGKVYLAWDTQLLQNVAIKKTALPALAEKDGTKLLQRLKHTHIASYLDSYEDEGYFYIVMRYIEGENLSAYKQRLTKKEIEKLAQILLDILQEIWRQGLLYADLKPANILFDGKTYYLVDFGSLRLMKSAKSRFGSPAYASWEYLNGRPCDWRSDLYSLAKVLNDLYQRPNIFWQLWYRKAIKLKASQRFKTPIQARFYLIQWSKIGKVLLIFNLILGLCYGLVKELCFQECLNNGDYGEALELYPKRLEVFENFVTNGNAKDLEFWNKLEELGVNEVQDDDFLWTCVLLLTQNTTSECWKFQRQLLENVALPKAIHRLNLFETNNFVEFEKIAKDSSERYFLYAYGLYGIKSCRKEDYEFLWHCLENEKQLDEKQQISLMLRYALLVNDNLYIEVTLNKLFQQNDYFYEKALLCYRLFQNGNYQNNWLHLAMEQLRLTALDKRGQELYEMIQEEIRQWGELA